MLLSASNLSVDYGPVSAARGIDLAVDEGEIVEIAPPDEFFASPRSERTKLFLSQILSP